ncbi:MAG: hypothetical protein SF028_05080 [Candidatus Sumerlaeia bacterium]|nr:hypothetical protein [Candidatus Sumerlaeia bacterium]
MTAAECLASCGTRCGSLAKSTFGRSGLSVLLLALLLVSIGLNMYQLALRNSIIRGVSSKLAVAPRIALSEATVNSQEDSTRIWWTRGAVLEKGRKYSYLAAKLGNTHLLVVPGEHLAGQDEETEKKLELLMEALGGSRELQSLERQVLIVVEDDP